MSNETPKDTDLETQKPSQTPMHRLSIGRLTLLMVSLGSLGAIFVLIFGAAQPDALSVIGSGLMVAGAGLFAGGILGFLFGIPRVVDSETTDRQNGQTAQPFRHSTNLQQISDWLTKILVGVGLTQIAGLGSRIQGVSTFFAPALGGGSTAGPFAVATLTYFTALGFMIGYVWTAAYLAAMMSQAWSYLAGLITSNREDTAQLQSEMGVVVRRLSDNPGPPPLAEGEPIALQQGQKKALSALNNPEYRFRSLGGLLRETKLSQDELEPALQQLHESGLAARNTLGGQDWWFPTAKGQMKK